MVPTTHTDYCAHNKRPEGDIQDWAGHVDQHSRNRGASCQDQERKQSVAIVIHLVTNTYDEVGHVHVGLGAEICQQWVQAIGPDDSTPKGIGEEKAACRTWQ